VDRLLTVVDGAGREESTELPDDLRLVRAVDRPVDRAAGGRVGRILLGVGLAVPQDAEPPELRLLDPDELLRVGAAARADLEGAHPRLRRAELLVHPVLDREAVAIPSRDVRGVEPHHRPGLHDDVLQDLVQALAEMDAVVRVRGPVVEDEPGAPRARAADEAVGVDPVPPIDQGRLPFGEVRLHRKIGPREVDRALKFNVLGHL